MTQEELAPAINVLILLLFTSVGLLGIIFSAQYIISKQAVKAKNEENQVKEEEKNPVWQRGLIYVVNRVLIAMLLLNFQSITGVGNMMTWGAFLALCVPYSSSRVLMNLSVIMVIFGGVALIGLM